MKRKSRKSGIVERGGVAKKSKGGVGKRGVVVGSGYTENLYLDAAISCTQAFILHLDALLKKFDNFHDFLEKNEQEN